MADQHETPLLTALAIAAHRPHAPFYAPGHKRGQGTLDRLQALLGSQVFRADLPELPELDNLFAPNGAIKQAQALAAEAFGAEETYFLANGSTCGIEAAILAVCSPGEKVLVPRNAHRSVLAALVLSGARPVYLAPVHSKQWDLAFGITPEQVAQALIIHADICAVVVVSPNYQGVCSDVAAIAQVVHAHGVPLIVDEAHGAHLSFHDDLPRGAIAAGADLVIQSTHKTLAALTQASMLHLQSHRVNRDRLRQALQLTQSTSPSYLLLASLDAARQQMATTGKALIGKTLQIAQTVRSQLSDLKLLTVLSDQDLAVTSAPFSLDPTRIAVNLSALGITGFAADELLHEALGVTAELPTLRQLTFILSLGNTEADGDRLGQALATLVERSPALPPALPSPLEGASQAVPLISMPPITPRAAFFADARTVGRAEAVGQICADVVCPYPPGIPVLLPGEVVAETAIAQLQQIHHAGGVITGSLDDDCQTIRIITST